MLRHRTIGIQATVVRATRLTCALDRTRVCGFAQFLPVSLDSGAETSGKRKSWLLCPAAYRLPIFSEVSFTGDPGVAKPLPLKLLLVEDDDDFRDMCSKYMTLQSFDVEAVANGQEALRRCDLKHFDVAVVDMNMPGISGLELLQRLKERNLDTEVIILTGQATVENAVQAMKFGACDYLMKPFPLSELEQRIRNAAEKGRMQKENVRLKTLLEQHRPKTHMVGESPQMKEVHRLIERVGPTDKAVLIQGESGTGKELVARAIQQQSTRADKPFVTINCAALPEQLVESELFGHEKGSFTGAVATKPGLFEVADGGTLFIDEIGELPLSLQPKLLRVLEDGSLRRVGSHQERKVDVRLVAATNRDLQKEVQEGRFREDLYYRINVMALVLPPLRERQGDIPILVRHFLGPDWDVELKAQAAIESYRWPGNVRQLINALERATILAEDRTITLDDLPRDVAEAPPANVRTSPASDAAGNCDESADDLNRLDDLQRQHILAVLDRERGNKARAARVLGIHRRKLYRLLERYGISTDGS
jgi:DNA-binding NtrC family response regulator